MQKSMIVMGCILILVNFLPADWLIKTRNHTGATEMMGRKVPASDIINQTWVSDEAVIFNSAFGRILFHFKTDDIFIINDQERTYVKTRFPVMLKDIFPEKLITLLEMVKTTVSITPTESTRTIGDWKCKKYLMTMTLPMGGSMQSEVWTTENLPFDHRRLVRAQQSFQQIKIINNPGEFQKLKGFPILTETRVNAVVTTFSSHSRIIIIKQEKPPSGTYDIPGGYKQVKKLKLNLAGLSF